VVELLQKFYKETGLKPERIVFYRDGVSQGQFSQVMATEVAAILKACETLDKYYKPTLTFIIVQKRHHARFFPIEQHDADRSENCLPGTIIGTDVVHPFEFDFYLQAHAAIKGTARPAHYYVLYDDNNFNADSLQGLTYKLCYIYARSSCSVSVVPSVYYADLVAARAHCHRLGGDWSDFRLTELNDTKAQIAEYAVVKPELQNIMYFI
jgi:eukaryotic translation initiation factor 2C